MDIEFQFESDNIDLDLETDDHNLSQTITESNFDNTVLDIGDELLAQELVV